MNRAKIGIPCRTRGIGGFLYDRNGNYDVTWIIAMVLGVLAALINLPVRETPIQRAVPQGA